MLSGIFSSDLEKWNYEITRKDKNEDNIDDQNQGFEININSSSIPELKDDVFRKHKNAEDLKEFF